MGICASAESDLIHELKIYDEDSAIFENTAEHFDCKGVKDLESIEHEREIEEAMKRADIDFDHIDDEAFVDNFRNYY